MEKMLSSVRAAGVGAGALAQPARTKIAPKVQNSARRRGINGLGSKTNLRWFGRAIKGEAEDHNGGGKYTTLSHNCKQFVAILHIFTFPPGKFTQGFFVFRSIKNAQ